MFFSIIHLQILGLFILSLQQQILNETIHYFAMQLIHVMDPIQVLYNSFLLNANLFSLSNGVSTRAINEYLIETRGKWSIINFRTKKLFAFSIAGCFTEYLFSLGSPAKH